MLSDRLTELVDAGLVVRKVDAGPPLRVSYGLTEAGQAMRPALHELGKWAGAVSAGGRPLRRRSTRAACD